MRPGAPKRGLSTPIMAIVAFLVSLTIFALSAVLSLLPDVKLRFCRWSGRSLCWPWQVSN